MSSCVWCCGTPVSRVDHGSSVLPPAASASSADSVNSRRSSGPRAEAPAAALISLRPFVSLAAVDPPYSPAPAAHGGGRWGASSPSLSPRDADMFLPTTRASSSPLPPLSADVSAAAAPLAASPLPRTVGGKHPLIFISYCWAQKPLAAALVARLRSWGVSYWIDDEHLRPGAYLLPTVKEAINKSDRFLCIVSDEYLESENCCLELLHAAERKMERKNFIVPLVTFRFSKKPWEGKKAKLDLVFSELGSVLVQRLCSDLWDRYAAIWKTDKYKRRREAGEKEESISQDPDLQSACAGIEEELYAKIDDDDFRKLLPDDDLAGSPFAPPKQPPREAALVSIPKLVRLRPTVASGDAASNALTPPSDFDALVNAFNAIDAVAKVLESSPQWLVPSPLFGDLRGALRNAEWRLSDLNAALQFPDKDVRLAFEQRIMCESPSVESRPSGGAASASSSPDAADVAAPAPRAFGATAFVRRLRALASMLGKNAAFQSDPFVLAAGGSPVATALTNLATITVKALQENLYEASRARAGAGAGAPSSAPGEAGATAAAVADVEPLAGNGNFISAACICADRAGCSNRRRELAAALLCTLSISNSVGERVWCTLDLLQAVLVAPADCSSSSSTLGGGAASLSPRSDDGAAYRSIAEVSGASDALYGLSSLCIPGADWPSKALDPAAEAMGVISAWAPPRTLLPAVSAAAAAAAAAVAPRGDVPLPSVPVHDAVSLLLRIATDCVSAGATSVAAFALKALSSLFQRPEVHVAGKREPETTIYGSMLDGFVQSTANLPRLHDVLSRLAAKCSLPLTSSPVADTSGAGTSAPSPPSPLFLPGGAVVMPTPSPSGSVGLAGAAVDPPIIALPPTAVNSPQMPRPAPPPPRQSWLFSASPQESSKLSQALDCAADLCSRAIWACRTFYPRKKKSAGDAVILTGMRFGEDCLSTVVSLLSSSTKEEGSPAISGLPTFSSSTAQSLVELVRNIYKLKNSKELPGVMLPKSGVVACLCRLVASLDDFARQEQQLLLRQGVGGAVSGTSASITSPPRLCDALPPSLVKIAKSTLETLQIVGAKGESDSGRNWAKDDRERLFGLIAALLQMGAAEMVENPALLAESSRHGKVFTLIKGALASLEVFLKPTEYLVMCRNTFAEGQTAGILCDALEASMTSIAGKLQQLGAATTTSSTSTMSKEQQFALLECAGSIAHCTTLALYYDGLRAELHKDSSNTSIWRRKRMESALAVCCTQTHVFQGDGVALTVGGHAAEGDAAAIMQARRSLEDAQGKVRAVTSSCTLA